MAHDRVKVGALVVSAVVAPAVVAPAFAEDGSEIDEDHRCWLEPGWVDGDRTVYWAFKESDDWSPVVAAAVRARVSQWNGVVASDGAPYVRFVEWLPGFSGDGDPGTPDAADFEVVVVNKAGEMHTECPPGGTLGSVEVGWDLANPSSDPDLAPYVDEFAEHVAGSVLHEFGHVAVMVTRPAAGGESPFPFGHTSGRANPQMVADPFGWDDPGIANVAGLGVDAVPVPPAMSTCRSRGFGPDYEAVSTPWAPPLAGSQWGTVNQQLYPTLATVTADDAAYLSSALEPLISPDQYWHAPVTANPGFEQLGGGQQVAKWWKRSGGAWMVWSDGGVSGSRFLRWSPTTAEQSLSPEWPTAVGMSRWDPAWPGDMRGFRHRVLVVVRGVYGQYPSVALRSRVRGVKWSGDGCAPGKPSQHADGMNWNGRVFTNTWWEEERVFDADWFEQLGGPNQWRNVSVTNRAYGVCDVGDWGGCLAQGVDVWPSMRVLSAQTVDVDDFHAEVDHDPDEF